MKRFLAENQQKLLRVFLTNPDQSFYMQELGRILGKRPGVFQRTLNALEEEGLIKSEYRARSRFFQANVQHPLYRDLKNIISKTVGVEGVLREMVQRLKEVKTALIFGSFAKGNERKDSDIDLLIVGQPGAEKKLLKEIPRYEKQLQREINYKLFSEREYLDKKKGRDPFLEEVLSDKKIVLKGSLDVV